MSGVDISTFKNLAETRSSAVITVDTNTGDLRVRGNNVFNRVISWVRNKFQDPTTRQVEQEAAYNSFIRAMHESSYYDADEKESTLLHLSQDVRLGKPLTTRRVRQILTQLETPTVGSLKLNLRDYHENLVAANFMAGRSETDYYLSRALTEGIEQRPALSATDYSVRPEDQERLSQRIYDAVLAATGDDPRRPTHVVEYAEGADIAERLIDEFLDSEEQRVNSEETDAAVTQEPIVEQDGTSSPERVDAGATEDAAIERQQDTQVVGGPGQKGAESRLSRLVSRLKPKKVPEVRDVGSEYRTSLTDVKTLSQRLQSLNLPREVRSEMRRLIAERHVTTLEELTRRTNRNTATWIEDNRIGKWYMEGLENAGMSVPKRGTVPQQLVDAIVSSVATRDSLYDYNDVKSFARREIRSWFNQGA